MPTKTKFLLIVLLLIVVLLLGIKVNVWRNPPAPIAPTPTPVPSIEPSPSNKTFTSTDCGVVMEYPYYFELQEASDSARLFRGAEMIELVCAPELPRPAVSQDLQEEASVAGQMATIYHDSSAETNMPLDVVMFTHPQRDLEIALFGYGEVFDQVLTKLQLLL